MHEVHSNTMGFVHFCQEYSKLQQERLARDKSINYKKNMDINHLVINLAAQKAAI
jgi:hypothetical protein